MNFKVTFLGTGPSLGVPVVGCECPVCTSGNPRNRRFRSSIRVDTEEGTFVVDAGPDFHHQALATKLKNLDGIVFTHAHADHILGLDEVRVFNFRTKRAMPLHGTEDTFRQIKRVFYYAFDPDNPYIWKPQYDLQPIHAGEPFEICGLELLPIAAEHGGSEVLGFRMGAPDSGGAAGGPFAYFTDVHELPESSYHALRGLDAVTLNALQHKAHPTHLNLDEALAALKKIGAKASYLTHMTHEFDYGALSQNLPGGIFMAYDGLTMEF